MENRIPTAQLLGWTLLWAVVVRVTRAPSTTAACTVSPGAIV